MRNIWRPTGALAALCILLLSFCGCDLLSQLGLEPKTDEELIRERVETFITAYNTGDIDAALDCFDAKSRKTYGAIFNIGNNIVGSLTGGIVDVNDLFALAVGMSNDDLLSMELQSIAINTETTATVVLTVTYSDARIDVNESYEDMSLQMVKEDGDWYIYAQMDWESILY